MENLKISNRRLQLGKCGEYLAKIEFITNDFEVYSSDVDDRGIDLVVRKNKGSRFFEIQVKAVNEGGYVFMQEDVFSPKENLYLLLLIFGADGNPTVMLIPSLEWRRNSYPFFVYRNYEGKKSKPEYGINFSKDSLAIIKSDFAFNKRITELMSVEKTVAHSTGQNL